MKSLICWKEALGSHVCAVVYATTQFTVYRIKETVST